MPKEINESTIKLIWENNPDTPITSSTLSKSMDYVSSYRDFEFASGINGSGIIFAKDPNPPSGAQDRIIMKRETVISIINLELRIPINQQYKIFDVGLEDLYIRVEDQDDNPANPQPYATLWGNNKEWFIHLCDAENELSGQLLASTGKISPVQTQVLGNPSYFYNANNSRLIGGFKTDGFGLIIEESIWDISGKYKRVKAEEYMILDINTANTEDPYNRSIYRKLRISDLDSVSGDLNVINGDLLVSGTATIGGETAIDDNLKITSGDIYMEDRLLLSSVYHENGNAFYLGSGGAAVIGGGEAAYTAKANPADIPISSEDIYLIADSGLNVITNVQAGWSSRIDAMTITNTGNITTSGTLKIGSAGTFQANQSSPTGTAVLGYNGYFYATRVYNAVWNDLAEFFLSHAPKIIGKVYSIGDDGKVNFSNKYGDSKVVGVCTGTPAFLMKTEYENQGGVPIALSGTVDVQICCSIKRGEMLTSSTFGMAKKANWFIKAFRRDAIIGKAMTDSKKDDKTVLMLVR